MTTPPPADADRRIRRIAVVGGGTAGWLAAAMLARALNGTAAIEVIEAPDIGTIGVGEATIPPIIDLLRFLQIDEADFVRHTSATYKLGIVFADWGAVGERYWHPFGTFGAPIARRPFFHAWQRAQARGLAPRFADFSLAAALGDAGRFAFPDPRGSGPAAGLRYALHFDAALVARYLRAYAERLGVTCVDKQVATARQRGDGFVETLVFTDGSTLDADLFLDCSGFRGVLIEQVLGTGYVDWSDMLPCDRAVALPTANSPARPPFTSASALAAGWRWRIPLQHRAGNGYVYSSRHLSDDAALGGLLAAVGQPPLAEPRLIRFTTGRRRQFWNRNVVALGLASGFLEPLESTSIHLVTSAVHNLLDRFPDRDFAAANIAAYNAEMIDEIEGVRDFIVLHYCLTRRDDTPFWRECRALPLPEQLAARIAGYRATGRVRPRSGELFTDLSWFYVLAGMGVVPAADDPLLDVVGDDQLRAILAELAAATARSVAAAPPHDSRFAAVRLRA